MKLNMYSLYPDRMGDIQTLKHYITNQAKSTGMQISMLEEVANGLRNRGIRMLLSIVTKDKTLTQPIQRELLGEATQGRRDLSGIDWEALGRRVHERLPVLEGAH